MHILIISRSYPNRINPASGNFVKNQVEALAEHNLKIGIAGVYNVSLKEAKVPGNISKYGFYKKVDDNITEYTHLYPVIPKMHALNHRIKLHIWKKLLRKYIEENGKPDLIHVHTFEAGDVAIWAKEQYGIDFLLTEHTSLFAGNKALDWHYKLAKETYGKSALNLAVSKEAAKQLSDLFNVDFQYFPNFVNTSKFKLKKTKDKETTRQFINIAYLNENKNQAMLIRAFHRAFDNDSGIKLRIIGSGALKSSLQGLIKSLGNTNIELLGYLPQDEVIKELQKSDYFALSSNFETFGVVLIEAMACGLPVLSTACGGPQSIITDTALGLLSPVGDEVAFAEKLREITQKKYNPEYIRKYAIDNFSYETLSKRLIEIYKDILQQ